MSLVSAGPGACRVRNWQPALDSLRADPEVEFVEIDQRRYAQALPADPLYADQWYLQADQPSAVNFTAAWDLTHRQP